MDQLTSRIHVESAWSRKKFLQIISGTSVAMMLKPLSGWAIGEIDPRVAAIVASTIGVDTHNHIDLPLTAGTSVPTIDLAGDMKQSGLSAICATFAIDYQKIQQPGEAYERFNNWFNAMDQQLLVNKIKRSLNLADLNAAHKNHEVTIVQSVEGCHFLEGQLNRVEIAYGRGLRHLGLLHDSDASVPLGDVYTNPPVLGGLTAFGADVIKECNRLGILIDLAHASSATVAAALKVAAHPVLVSHTGLDTRLGNNPSFAQMMKPRLISKEHAKVIADAGGVIGVWTHLSDSPLEYAQNIRALVDVIGIDHVCIGTDTKLTPGNSRPGGPPPGQAGNPKDSSSKESPRQPAGAAQNQVRIGERTNMAWKDQTVGFYFAVVEAMLKTGFTADDIGKVGGGNFCRVFNSATGAKRK